MTTPRSEIETPLQQSATNLDPARVLAAYERACAALEAAQQPRGAWAGEVVWNPMLVSQYVICCHIVGHEIPEARRRRIRLNLERERKRDGGWGMHPDPPPDSWMFHTVLAYVALRLLGDPASDPLLAEALDWIHAHGGPERAPTWGRIWLALLGLYPWSELQPLVPELWLLPTNAPLHPRRLYCHMRLIYLGLSYLYGDRTQADASPLIEELRAELYPLASGGWSRRRFMDARDDIATTDLHEPIGAGLDWVFRAARVASRFVPRHLRRRALARAFEHIEFEFHSTDWVCLSPVNGMLFCLAMWSRDRRDPRLARALEGVEYWVWEDDDEGMRICGARSDIWDSSFAIAALCEGPELDAAARLVGRACPWLSAAQMKTEIEGGRAHHREPARGGWGFADERHPWPVSDCTAEALEALLRAGARGWDSSFDRDQALAAVEFILLRQNDDGGFGSYEPRRGAMALARFNPAEMFGNCMLEYSYTECTASCVRGLAVARDELELPTQLRARVDAAIDAGVAALLEAQEASGGWAGFWGVNYCYGTHFAVSGLLAAGLPRDHAAITRAVEFLLARQRDDGGWGERYEGVIESRERGLPEGATSRVVQTAWAVLTLEDAREPDRESAAQESAVQESAVHRAIDRGVEFLLQRQLDTGGWPHDASVGVFFNTAVLNYRLYKLVFPARAIARWLTFHDVQKRPLPGRES